MGSNLSCIEGNESLVESNPNKQTDQVDQKISFLSQHKISQYKCLFFLLSAFKMYKFLCISI